MTILVKGNREIEVLEHEVEALLEDGWEVFEQNEEASKETSSINLTVAEIKEKLDVLGVEYPANAKKEELLRLLEGGE